jgi:acyl-CoA hydrolase
MGRDDHNHTSNVTPITPICDDARTLYGDFSLNGRTLPGMPEMISTLDACVERIFAFAGSELRVAAPLGLGKPNVLLNAIYHRVVADTALRLDLHTALSLARPQAKSDLEKRFLDPFLARHFGADYPDLAYVAAQLSGGLPGNVRVQEFYLQSGAMLGVASAQQAYASMNYTHVARDLFDRRINVIVQLVAAREEAGQVRYSLACNPDVTADLLDAMRAAGVPRPLVVGVVHADLPFVGNEALVEPGFFDALLFDHACRQTLFALPRDPIDNVEHAIGLHASALVRDGGTLQIGIGALSDALVYASLLRHSDNAQYREALQALGVAACAAENEAGATLIDRIGGMGPFQRGLYGASEMVMDGFMHLAKAGILSRRVYDDFGLETALEDGCIEETLHSHAGDALHALGALPDRIDERELARLIRFGLLPPETQMYGMVLRLPDGSSVSVDLTSSDSRLQWNRALSGRKLREGRYLRGAFYLGSTDFYAWLRALQGEEFDGLSMTRVSDINQLYGGKEALDALQRRDGRFFNTCMMATVLGAAVSDALEDGQVVSGVGGQYNFVAMAHALHGGRSILLLRSTRKHRGRLASNIVWNYGHTTIPRHLRDIYVTEYGTADLRGKSDEDCIIAMLAIADARFQDDLITQAKAAGKLRSDFSIPAKWRANTPQRLAAALGPARADGLFPTFPFGSDFSAEELQLLPALKTLQAAASSPMRLATFLLRSLRPLTVSADFQTLLRRLGLDRTRGLHEWITRRMVLSALSQAPGKQR